MTRLKVDPGQLEQAESEIKAAAAQLDGILDGLAAKLEAMEWQGQDQAAYEEYKAKWAKATQGLNETLNRIGATVGQAREEYVNTELYNAKQFQV
ncbi:hypothetical protein Afil01_66080 [Actinorhabdospora filicis]|uniref:ESAT-6-like protein n=1 Tax=Actinorhabdospora filicis TaxID=1785913 RepID=A0A9W6WDN7_9ACTN|nr:WXG100 family type VII secretion target [Actinorhabdospora filicis]GLZ81801.1 hypothetical protein Afil01_66080 [Actinorhabdospora filicis]